MRCSTRSTHAAPCPPLRRRPRSTRPALTLVEVLCGLVILGTVVASLAAARGRFLRQWGEAEQRLQATRALDARIAEWTAAESIGVPVPAEGSLAGVPGGVWRTRRIADRSAASLGASMVRVEAFSSRPDAPPAAAIVSVDLLVHNPPPGTGTRAPSNVASGGAR